MSQFERRVRAAINPLSTAVSRWWCHSAFRRRLTGYGPAAGQPRPVRYRVPRSGPPSAPRRPPS